ncbi:DUF72 domain-containing protein [Pseudomonas massiliensis]|uniref:DUF72 domain-containing protein n=1 Tax=Pseudomonas massiliensis TaxID=522492 RepID=UPI00058D4A67|nr:DUF72 domain-containing protein [Pseudomonas massiliensis]
MGDIRIGISGWRYAPWRGDFYPKGLAQANELAFASRAVRAIEINGSFYALQAPDRYAQWYTATPQGFMFSVKGPRYVTHTRRLKDIEGPLANFYASGMFQLKEKLGPFLWQFPATFRFEPKLFEAFLTLLPRTGAQARALAEQGAERLRKPGYLDIPQRIRLRHAVEIRHESFATPAFIDLLRRHGVALVVADTAGKWPYAEDLTADFVYIRLHGDAKLYESGYSGETLDRWQARIACWSQGRQAPSPITISPAQGRRRKSRDVFCFFDNDLKVHAPYDARALLERLGLSDALQVQPGRLPGQVPW